MFCMFQKNLSDMEDIYTNIQYLSHYLHHELWKLYLRTSKTNFNFVLHFIDFYDIESILIKVYVLESIAHDSIDKQILEALNW